MWLLLWSLFNLNHSVDFKGKESQSLLEDLIKKIASLSRSSGKAGGLMSQISPLLLLSMVPKLPCSRIDTPQSRRQGILPLGLESKRHPIRSVLIHSAEYATSPVFNVFTNVSPLGSVEIFNKLLISPEINSNHKNQNKGLHFLLSLKSSFCNSYKSSPNMAIYNLHSSDRKNILSSSYFVQHNHTGALEQKWPNDPAANK